MTFPALTPSKLTPSTAIASRPPPQQTTGWTLTGRHVLAALAVFFGVLFAVNGVFVYFALTTFTGVETEDAYRKGVRYNVSLEEARQLSGLGWQGRLSGQDRRIELRLSSADGKPVTGVRIAGKVGRPAIDSFDQPVTFEEVDPGVFRTPQLGLSPGNWIVAVEAVDPLAANTGARYRLKERLWLSQ